MTALLSTTMTKVAPTWSLLDIGTGNGIQRVLITVPCSLASPYCQGKAAYLEPIRWSSFVISSLLNIFRRGTRLRTGSWSVAGLTWLSCAVTSTGSLGLRKRSATGFQGRDSMTRFQEFCKWLHRLNRGECLSDLEKKQGVDAPHRALLPTPGTDHEDERSTQEEVPEASEPDEQLGEPETCEGEGAAVWDDERQVDGAEQDTEEAVEAQVAESAPDLKARYEAEINSHEVEAHQPFLEPQPSVRCDQALELEILKECFHDIESCIFEGAPPIDECSAFEALAKYQVDVSTDAEAKRKATPCGWPCSI